ncbi:hypothetical protein FCV25MIE_04347 [Fagus crenata]
MQKQSKVGLINMSVKGNNPEEQRSVPFSATSFNLFAPQMLMTKHTLKLTTAVGSDLIKRARPVSRQSGSLNRARVVNEFGVWAVESCLGSDKMFET